MFSIERPAQRIQEGSEPAQEELRRDLREAEQRSAALQRELDRQQADARSLGRLEAHVRKGLENKSASAAASAAQARAGLAQYRRRAETEERRREDLAARLAQANAAIGNLKFEVAKAQAERAAIAASLSWRGTAPLRAAFHAVPTPIWKRIRKGSKLIVWTVTLRLRSKLREQQEREQSLRTIRGSHLFDASWYLREYPDVAAAGSEPALHYLQLGGTEDRNPGPAFDACWYCKQYPDVAASGVNPLLHYLQSGHAEGRQIRPVQVEETPQEPQDPELQREAELLAKSPFFDSKWYYEQYPDIAEAKIDAIEHYLRSGAAEGRNPGPEFDGNWYLQDNPDVAASGHNPLLHYVEHGLAEERERRPVQLMPGLHWALQIRYDALLPLRTFLIPKTAPRVTMLTDSINARSLYGGVGTALILSALLAERIGGTLRLITRIESADAPNFRHVLSINGIEWNGSVEFVYSGPKHEREISVSENDLFLTTSWWGTRSLLGAVDPRRIIYLLQEDERMFYPFGDDHLRCEETLSCPDIRFVVNSELLFEHLTTGPNALPNIRRNGSFFEPAFPESHYYPAAVKRTPGSKRNFFFYARPRNERNLYWRGLEAIGAALEADILRPEDWEFYFVGRAIKEVTLPRNVNPVVLQDLSWQEYAALVRSIDLGLSLMDTPHPSYPPLDLAASGAVVVTNTHGLKTSLAQYSENILTVKPTVDSLKNGMEAGARLACDEALRFANYSHNRLLRNWRTAFEPAVRHLTLAGEHNGN